MTAPLTPQQLAKHWSTTEKAVNRLIKSGALVAINIGSGKQKPRYRIAVEAIAEFEAARRTVKPRVERRRASERILKIV